MNRLLMIPCLAMLVVFAAVVMVRGSQDPTRQDRSDRQSAARAAPATKMSFTDHTLMTIDEADEAVLKEWPSKSRKAIFSRGGPISKLSAITSWHIANVSTEQWQTNAFVGQLIVYVNSRDLADGDAAEPIPPMQRLPICVDRVTGFIGIHANGRWQTYDHWLAENLPKLKRATGFGETSR